MGSDLVRVFVIVPFLKAAVVSCLELPRGPSFPNSRVRGHSVFTRTVQLGLVCWSWEYVLIDAMMIMSRGTIDVMGKLDSSEVGMFRKERERERERERKRGREPIVHQTRTARGKVWCWNSPCIHIVSNDRKHL
jgi:hypothetical protein